MPQKPCKNSQVQVDACKPDTQETDSWGSVASQPTWNDKFQANVKEKADSN